ncbi:MULTISPECIES: SURF1 family cytochrome oxidase biogenesis protein [Pseudonocardia]|uniref:SURF1-like protein n=2 Tax=Pseudonocardia TaxID=1847 RepID=A0A1Y2MSD9_PSEAH|nr:MULTISPECIES: SURF1 family protein [Pseudonocardia]OSY37879.1 SURF1 family protein [Pseudonocardia autotrophica]TDN72458.1 cytochrome oxidase assembly protein ShyY1 [Pseudonocardia autotrophica]BBG03167.1 SURF1-like protein [Pseudonocardia autotrophica]GEC23783.1 SURF1-like protein [Pseudonocardia saturnea]
MRFLLRPGWLAFIGVVCAFVVACYTLLAPWQFGREAERESQNAAIAAAHDTPAVPFAELVPPGAAVSSDDIWRRVELTGTFERDAESLVRLRVVDGAPAYEVLTPLRLTDGRLVVVNRGTVAAGEGGVVPDIAAAPDGTVNVEGRLRLNENDPQGRPPLLDGGTRQIYAADSRAVAEATGTTPVEGIVSLDEGQAGVLNPIPIAPPGGGAPFSNFSYALQWLTFGVVALVALVIFIRLELLQRRGRRDPRGSLREQLSGRDGYGGEGRADR